jgi:DNA-binding transcriptional ArsR family regulator
VTPADIKTSSYQKTVDILRMLGRSDRLKIMIALHDGRRTVTDLILILHEGLSPNHSSQTSAALAPMRRLGLITSEHQDKRSYYRLTKQGRKIMDLIHLMMISEEDDDQ